GSCAGNIVRDPGHPPFNAGMRGWKSSAYDGGHRVPCFWHWPAGGLTGGRDVPLLSAHIDLLPTLVDLLGLKKPDGPPLDGVSLRPPLLDEAKPMPERTLFVHMQRAFLPPKWKNSAVMTRQWRLIDGKELHDITADPGQKTDVAADHPEIVRRLRGDYETWWTSLAPAIEHTVRYVLGGEENPMTLCSHDWLMPGVEPAAWHQNQIKRGELINGPWAVDVKQSGTYEITLHRWAPYLNKPMETNGARLRIGGIDESQSLEKDATGATFRVKLEAGPAMLQTWLTRPDGKQHGAYYTSVRLLAD
nr:sulfatase-like hydrolase/transferase [Akkermansiaceae bacterium]